ncbi:protein HflC [Planctomycetales bacterium]|nr:protein HflC [Planctomycetales bacterium]GHS99968.1 protein HflC [Planctomycetales bacterium]GHV22326.1 protein HflC [Planctomycetales bacterium]
MNNQRAWTIAVAAALVILLAAVCLTFTVNEGEQAVVYTFGGIREGGVKKIPGAYFRLPPGIERVEKVDTRLRALEIKNTEIVTTRDQNHIYLTLAMAWRVNDAEKYLRRMANDAGWRSEANAANMLSSLARGARQTVVSSFALTDLVSDRPEQAATFAQVETALLRQIQSDLQKSDYGIAVDKVFITRLALPKDTIKEINARMIKERQTHSERNVTAGKEEAKKIVSRANLEKQNLLSEATAKARQIKGEGDAAAAEFYQEFKQNPQLAIFLRRLDALEAILKNKATVALPVDNPLGGIIEAAPTGP